MVGVPQVQEWAAWYLNTDKFERILKKQWSTFEYKKEYLRDARATIFLDPAQPFAFCITHVKSISADKKQTLKLKVSTEVTHSQASATQYSFAQFTYAPPRDSQQTAPVAVEQSSGKGPELGAAVGGGGDIVVERKEGQSGGCLPRTELRGGKVLFTQDDLDDDDEDEEEDNLERAELEILNEPLSGSKSRGAEKVSDGGTYGAGCGLTVKTTTTTVTIFPAGEDTNEATDDSGDDVVAATASVADRDSDADGAVNRSPYGHRKAKEGEPIAEQGGPSSGRSIGDSSHHKPGPSSSSRHTHSSRCTSTLLSTLHPRLGVMVLRIQRMNAHFAATLRKELQKVEGFYSSQAKQLASAAAVCVESVKVDFASYTQTEKVQVFTLFRQTFYSLEMLQQYCDQNYQALGEVLNYYDKTTNQNSLMAYRATIGALPFRMGSESPIEKLKEDMRNALMDFTCGGDPEQVEAILYRDEGTTAGGGGRGGRNDFASLSLSLGCMGGMVFVLLVLIVTEFSTLPHPIIIENYEPVWYWFSISWIFIFALLLFGVGVYIWEKWRINYAFMFDLDPIFHWTGRQLIRDQLWYVFFWCVAAYAFLRTATTEMIACSARELPGGGSAIPAWVWPYFIIPLCLCWALGRAVVDPWRIPYATNWLLSTLKRVVLTPLYPVTFADFYVCAQLRTMALAEFEAQFFWCYVHAAEEDVGHACRAGYKMRIWVLPFFPALWRLLQCLRRYRDEPEATRKPFPNLVNAGKYVCDVITIFVSMFFYGMVRQYGEGGADRTTTETIAMIAFVVSRTLTAMYKLLWDTFVDCAMIRFNPKTWKLERNNRELIFPQKYYYSFMVVNSLLRFNWLARFILARQLGRLEWTIVVFGSIDVFRRFLWGIFRLENEQMNNVESYRATKLAPVPARTGGGVFATEKATVDGTATENVDVTYCAKQLRQLSEVYRGMQLSNLDLLPRLFTLLPQEEKMKILSSSGDSRMMAQFKGVAHEGKHRKFSSFCPMMQVHLFLVFLGERTLGQYCQTIQFVDPAFAVAL